MKPKNQRLVLVGAAILALVAAALLAMVGLRNQASFYFTPADLAASKAADYLLGFLPGEEALS